MAIIHKNTTVSSPIPSLHADHNGHEKPPAATTRGSNTNSRVAASAAAAAALPATVLSPTNIVQSPPGIMSGSQPKAKRKSSLMNRRICDNSASMPISSVGADEAMRKILVDSGGTTPPSCDSSLSSHDDQEAENPRTNPKKKKVVTFSTSVRMKSVSRRASAFYATLALCDGNGRGLSNDLWYTQEEIDDRIEEDMKLIKRMNELEGQREAKEEVVVPTTLTTTNSTTRGLEAKTMEGLKRAKHTQHVAKNAVFREQDRQRRETRAGADANIGYCTCLYLIHETCTTFGMPIRIERCSRS